MRQRRPFSGLTRGMTLVETMIVVAIIAFLSAMAVPQLLRLVRISRVAGDARELQGLLRSMRAQAITRGVPTVVCLRGRDFPFPGGEGPPNSAIGFRKGQPLPPNMCAAQGASGAPCAAFTVDPVVSAFDPAATPPDARSQDLMLMSDTGDVPATPMVTWALPITSQDETMQLVFTVDGQVVAFEGPDCSPTNAHVALAAGPWRLRLEYFGDNTINQLVIVQPDGTVDLP